MQHYPAHTDHQLLQQLHQSDEGAFAEIYNRYWKQLYLSALNILQVKEAAQDAVQEVFISLWKRREAVQIDALPSYLHQAVRFQVFKAIRAEKTDQDFFNRLAGISKDILIEDPVLFKEMETLYQQLIQSLPADEQEIFLLHRDDGLTYKQIAEQKNISVKTVEKKMSHALKEIRFGIDDAFVIVLAAGVIF
ncbi:sigma-70 family RNA polymerase sigma factor [Niastella caeni]|uniref:Sigma-70 family RNA polymerase sigma factor n=1 Tax=Niastella caeni TaxID=2569763 RepID=A0A4S8I1N8_9BACT|nr:sigma-70 family RNA polymerase sigma factor [Niastella caeni]THU39622.1 sigma-70 family RNA polymerase sigma factor [Niastella caeni]